MLGVRALNASTAPALDAALRALPAFDRNRSNAPFTNYGQLRVSFAGAGNDRGAVFVDGVPAQDGFGGQIDWNAYGTDEITAAELLRGPGSALYGSGAIGGALSLFTRRPAPNDIVFGAAAGGIDVGSGYGLVSSAIGNDTFASARFETRRLSYNVLPPSMASSVDRTARSTADVGIFSLAHVGGAQTLRVNVRNGDDAQEDGRPNYGFSRSIRQLDAHWTMQRRNAIDLLGYARAFTLTNLADRYPTVPGALLYTQHVPSSDAGVRAAVRIPLDPAGRGSNLLTVLAEHRAVTGRSDQLTPTNVVQSDVAGTQQLDGFVLQDAWESRLGGVVGVRYDTVATHALGTREERALSPRAALRYDLSPVVALRVAYGTGLRAPYLNELVRSFRIGNILMQNNPNLVAERSHSAQAGIDVAAGLGRFAFDWTGTRVVDAIGFRTLSPTLQQRANIGRTASDSYTAEYELPLRCTLLRASGTLNHARVVTGLPAQIGKRLAYVPDATAALDVERTVGPFTGALLLAYSGPTFADDIEQQPLGQALLVGARLTYAMRSGTTLSLGIDNVAGQQYLTSIDRLGPPASASLRVTVPVGAAAARFAPPAGCR